MDQKLPNIIYIMGTGRSGTTILEILIASNPGIAGAGELTHIFNDGACGNGHCSCGEKAWDCDRWGAVFRKLQLNSVSSRRYKRLVHRFDWHSGFFRQALGLFSGKEKEHYETINSKLFASISEVAGDRHVVDSSKYAGRAVALCRAYPERIKVICLMRSPMGLIKAFKNVDTGEQKPKPLIGIVLYYCFVVLCSRIAIHLVGRKNCTVISFEQLMQNPYDILNRIASLTGINLDQSIGKLKKDASFPISHIVTGNRLRRLGRINFKPKHSKYQPEGFGESVAEGLMRGLGRLFGFTH